jgi:hypothetical protein
VRWATDKQLFLDAPARYRLFQHADLLEELLAPHTAPCAWSSARAWSQKLGLKEAVRHVTPGLQQRFSAQDGQPTGSRAQFLYPGT